MIGLFSFQAIQNMSEARDGSEPQSAMFHMVIGQILGIRVEKVNGREFTCIHTAALTIPYLYTTESFGSVVDRLKASSEV